MTAVRWLARVFTQPVLSWIDAGVFAFLTLVSDQYTWAWWLQLLAFGGLGVLFAAEHDWLRWRSSRKKPAS